MDDSFRLQDSGLALCGLLADLLEVGVVLVDEERRCRFANPHACELVGVADLTALAPKWARFHALLGLDSLQTDPGGAPVRRPVNLETEAGARRLRMEAYALRGAFGTGVAVLLRDRAAVGEGDRQAVLATRATANRAILSGLVHGASGPLNNFNLTLALLDAGVDSLDQIPEAAPSSARFRRHLAVLRGEIARLDDCLAELRALADRVPAPRARIDVARIVHDVVHRLRHEATLREVTIAAAQMKAAWVDADRDAIALAFVALVSRLLHACAPGSVLRMSTAHVPNVRQCTVQIACALATPLAALDDELFAVRAKTSSDPGAATARMIVEAHGGTLTLEQTAADECVVLITLPSA